MEHTMLLLLLILCSFPTATPLVYYITPGDHADCTAVNGTALRPCFTLGQLVNDEVLKSSDESSVELSLLPGTHLILTNQTISFINAIVIHPFWNELQEDRVVIKCLSKVNPSFNFYPTALEISSLHFSGCALLIELAFSKLYVHIAECVFENWTTSNPEYYAINIDGSNFPSGLITISNCTFSSNNGSIATHFHDYVSFAFFHLMIKNAVFQDNEVKHGSGGAVYIKSNNLTVYNSQFVNNRAGGGGGALFADGVINLLLSTTLFSNNIASEDSSCDFCNGGALLLTSSPFGGNATINDCQFSNNSAKSGGAMGVAGITGTINAETSMKLANVSFIFNGAAVDGGAIYSDAGEHEESTFHFIVVGGYSFSNSAEKGRGGFACLLACSFQMEGDYNISSNRASNGAGIYARDSEFLVVAMVTVSKNIAGESGGGVHLTDSNIVVGSTLNRIGSLIFKNNVAHSKGGAILVYDEKNTCHVSSCFVKIDGILRFENNSAPQGAVLYGGLLDRCSFYEHTIYDSLDFFKKCYDKPAVPLAISSDPIRVCLCTEDQEVDCSTREIRYSRKRGQHIDVFGTVVDQDRNPKGSSIIAHFRDADAKLGEGEEMKETGNNCTKLSYHIITDSPSATLSLQPVEHCYNSRLSGIAIFITLLPCPRGFEAHEGRCKCDRRLTDFFKNPVCDIDTETVGRIGSIWLRYYEDYLKVHSHCPLDYCNMLDSISILHPDEQCANHRSGVLCGACQDKYSIALGSSKCLQCTSSRAMVWLIPVFALAGVALVALLLVCNMTVSHGTLNGLIFYSNVISITGLTGLRNCSIHPVLSVFIAWVNLDLGVETCFYSGMDTYQKTWLQFAFPLYILVLVGAVILASHYSSTAMKVFGRNNIAILATLFLLSYTKILKTIIAALDFTEVFQGSANNTSDQWMPYKVWTRDGNIEYLKGKHVPLFAVSLAMLVFLFLPYTLLLMFGQCIRSMPARRRCVLRYIRSTAFISIMDAYHAPYKRKHRYWTGLMLLTRCILFLAFTSSPSDNKLLTNMVITNLVLFGILTLKTFAMYKNFRMNILEICFLLNIAILSAITLLLLKNDSSNSDAICKCTSVSISVSVAIFIGILVYHAYLRINKTRCFTSIKDSLRPIRQYHMIPAAENAPPENPVLKPTTTTVDVREELQDILTDENHKNSLTSD